MGEILMTKYTTIERKEGLVLVSWLHKDLVHYGIQDSEGGMLRWKEDRIVKYYNEYVALEMRVESEVSMLSEHKRELRAALRRGEYTNKEYEPLVIPINKQIENAKTELSLFKYSELNRIFPQDHIPFCQIEEYVKKLKENEQK